MRGGMLEPSFGCEFMRAKDSKAKRRRCGTALVMAGIVVVLLHGCFDFSMPRFDFGSNWHGPSDTGGTSLTPQVWQPYISGAFQGSADIIITCGPVEHAFSRYGVILSDGVTKDTIQVDSAILYEATVTLSGLKAGTTYTVWSYIMGPADLSPPATFVETDDFGNWKQVADPPFSPCYGNLYFAAEAKAFVVTGSAYQRSLFTYSPSLNRWDSLSLGASNFGNAAVANNTCFLTSGSGFEQFDPIQGEFVFDWSPPPSAAAWPGLFFTDATSLYWSSGSSYATGGSQYDRSLWRFSLDSETWTRLHDAPINPANTLNSGFFADGNYVFSGMPYRNSATWPDSCWHYNASTDSWAVQDVTDPTSGTRQFAGVMGQGFAFAHFTSSGGGTISILTPGTQTWTPMAPLPLCTGTVSWYWQVMTDRSNLYLIYGNANGSRRACWKYVP